MAAHPAWATALLRECKADLMVHDDDNLQPFRVGDRVQGFFFTGTGGPGELPKPNGKDGLDETQDGSFYAGALKKCADGSAQFDTAFDDGEVEPSSRSDFRRVWSPVALLNGQDGVTPLGALWLLETARGRQACVLAAHNDATATYSVLSNLASDSGPKALLVSRRRLQRPPASGDVVYVPASALRAAGASAVPDTEEEVPCRCEAVAIGSANRSAAVDTTAYPSGFVPDATDTHGPDYTAEWAAKLRTVMLRTTATVKPLSRRRGGGASATAKAAAAAAKASGRAFEVELSSLRRALPRAAVGALLRAAGGVSSSRIGAEQLADVLMTGGVWRNREAARAALLAAEPTGKEGEELPVGAVMRAIDATPAGFDLDHEVTASAAAASAAAGSDSAGGDDDAGSESGSEADGASSRAAASAAAAGGGDADADAADGSAGSGSTNGLLLSALLRRALLAASKQERATEGGSSETIQSAFRALDTDGDGSLGEAELREVLHRIGAPRATDEELSALLQVLDDDGDGRVSLAELQQFVDDGAAAEGSAGGKRPPLVSRAKSALLAASVNAARGTGRALDPLAVFRAADANNSGRLSGRELARLLSQLGCDPLQYDDETAEWKGLLAQADVDADGGVSYAELVTLLAADEAVAAARRRG